MSSKWRSGFRGRSAAQYSRNRSFPWRTPPLPSITRTANGEVNTTSSEKCPRIASRSRAFHAASHRSVNVQAASVSMPATYRIDSRPRTYDVAPPRSSWRTSVDRPAGSGEARNWNPTVGGAHRADRAERRVPGAARGGRCRQGGDRGVRPLRRRPRARDDDVGSVAADRQSDAVQSSVHLRGRIGPRGARSLGRGGAVRVGLPAVTGRRSRRLHRLGAGGGEPLTDRPWIRAPRRTPTPRHRRGKADHPGPAGRGEGRLPPRRWRGVGVRRGALIQGRSVSGSPPPAPSR